MSASKPVCLYIARNHLGQYSAGHGWVDEFKDGRFYTKRGPVSGWVTRWAQSHRGQPVPEVLMWVIDPAKAQVFGTADETTKRVDKVRRAKAKRERENRLDQIQYLKDDIQQTKAELARLEGRA